MTFAGAKAVTFLKLGFFAVVLALLAALAMYYPVWVALPVLIVVPSIILVTVKAEVFEKVKLGTLIIGKVLVLLAFLQVIPGEWVGLVVLWLLRINIGEAVIKDLLKKNHLNALSGAVVLVSTWLITVQWSGVYYLIGPASTILWVLAYTLWNWQVVFSHFNRSISLYHIAVLASPLLFVAFMGDVSYWLIIRSATLLLAVTIQIAFKDKLVKALS